MTAEPHPPDAAARTRALADALALIDDLTRVIDVVTAGQDLPQRRHTLALANRLHQLRHDLDPAGEHPASPHTASWYRQLIGALDDGQPLARAAIETHLDHIEAIVDRATQRRTKLWWWTNNR